MAYLFIKIFKVLTPFSSGLDGLRSSNVENFLLILKRVQTNCEWCKLVSIDYWSRDQVEIVQFLQDPSASGDRAGQRENAFIFSCDGKMRAITSASGL